jgi:hypothetical protein
MLMLITPAVIATSVATTVYVYWDVCMLYGSLTPLNPLAVPVLTAVLSAFLVFVAALVEDKKKKKKC